MKSLFLSMVLAISATTAFADNNPCHMAIRELSDVAHTGGLNVLQAEFDYKSGTITKAEKDQWIKELLAYTEEQEDLAESLCTDKISYKKRLHVD